MGARAAADRRDARGRRADQDQSWRGVRRDADVRGRATDPGGAPTSRSTATSVAAHRRARGVAGLDPFRLDVHRADGSAGVESIDAPYATLNDAFWVRRRCRPEDAIYGLGEKTGRHNRRGREFTLWNTDVLNPHATRGVHAAGPGDRARPRASSSTPTTSRSRSSTTTPRTGRWRARSSTTATARAYDFREPDEYRFRFEGGQYTEYVFAGPVDAGHPRGLHVADGPRRSAAAVGARLPPVPLVRATRRTRSRRSAPATASSRHPVRRALARHRVHGRLPRVHVGHRTVPRRARRCSSACASRACA